jgi:hypothetical protein
VRQTLAVISILCKHTNSLDHKPSPVSASDYTHDHYMYFELIERCISVKEWDLCTVNAMFEVVMAISVMIAVLRVRDTVQCGRSLLF